MSAASRLLSRVGPSGWDCGKETRSTRLTRLYNELRRSRPAPNSNHQPDCTRSKETTTPRKISLPASVASVSRVLRSSCQWPSHHGSNAISRRLTMERLGNNRQTLPVGRGKKSVALDRKKKVA
eukprot:3734752-Rhodomonas_salina.2